MRQRDFDSTAQPPCWSKWPTWGLSCRVKIALMLITKKTFSLEVIFHCVWYKKMAKSSLSIYRDLHGVTNILKFAHVSMYFPWLSSFRHGDGLQTRVFERQSLIVTHFLARNDQKCIKHIIHRIHSYQKWYLKRKKKINLKFQFFVPPVFLICAFFTQ